MINIGIQRIKKNIFFQQIFVNLNNPYKYQVYATGKTVQHSV
jgi:hypothetical protein